MEHDSVVSDLGHHELVQENIVRLDVLVDDAFAMQHSQPPQHVQRNLKFSPQTKALLFLVEGVFQRAIGHELTEEDEAGVMLVESEEPNSVVAVDLSVGPQLVDKGSRLDFAFLRGGVSDFNGLAH